MSLNSERVFILLSYLQIHMLKSFIPDSLFQFTFPDNKHIPAIISKGCVVFFITFTVFFKLRPPIDLIGLWKNRIRTSFVAMPETSVNIYSCSVLREQNVGMYRISLIIFSEPQPFGKKKFTHHSLRLLMREIL